MSWGDLLFPDIFKGAALDLLLGGNDDRRRSPSETSRNTPVDLTELEEKVQNFMRLEELEKKFKSEIHRPRPMPGGLS
jgi:hypothetical protein